MKTLYFEGAGWADISKATNVGNCRIRTAFTNNNAEMIYIELGVTPRYTKNISNYYNRPYIPALGINHIFKITDLGCKNYNIKSNLIDYDWQDIRERYDYTKDDIVRFINENLNCSFDTMEVLDWMEGYKVHAEYRGYNLMDNHIVNPKRTKARNEAYSIIDKVYREHCQDKYSVINLKQMNEDTITVWCHASEGKLNGKPRTAIVNIWTQEVEYK